MPPLKPCGLRVCWVVFGAASWVESDMMTRPYRSRPAKGTGLTRAPTGRAKRRYGLSGLRLPLAIGRTAVADIERPPAADLVACAGRAIAGMRVIPPPGESRRRHCCVEDEERGGDGGNQNEIQSDHSGAPVYLGGLQCVLLSQHLVVPS